MIITKLLKLKKLNHQRVIFKKQSGHTLFYHYH